MIEFPVKEIKEGRARVLVPELPPGVHPANAPVFYNPAMKLNRDLTVSFLRVVKPRKILDALSGTGIKGIRIMLESDPRGEVVFNDINPLAVDLINKNLALNGLEARVENMDANILMRTERFDFIDLDPFGSPAPFVDSAASNMKKGYISVTATDTSALTGTYPRSGLRKYAVIVSRTSFMHELGVRALIGFVVREFAKYALALRPVLSQATLHYYRVIFEVRPGRMRAVKAMKTLKWLVYDRNTEDRWYSEIQEPGFENLGPVWSENLFDEEIISRMEPVSDESGEFLNLAREEARFNLPYVDTHVLAKVYGFDPVKVDAIIDALEASGFSASRTHFCHHCIKTDAQPSQIASLLTNKP